MKTRLLLSLFLLVPVFGQNTVKKPVQPRPAPVPVRPATAPASPVAQIEAAVRAKVAARYLYKPMGAAGITVAMVTVTITKTEPMQGWNGRWLTSGIAKLRLGGGGAGQLHGLSESERNQTRVFNASSTVSDAGKIEVDDINGS